MPLSIGTNYSGDVLNELLTLAVTGNEVVDQGHIYVQPGIKKQMSIPRMKLGNVVQPRAATPSSPGTGSFDYTERLLQPNDAMVYTEFNPRDFEDVWRPFQPEGELVFRELPPEIQVTMLSELLKQVNSWMGRNILQGDTGGSAPDNIFDGIITKAVADPDVATVGSPVSLTKSNVIDEIDRTYNLIPYEVRNDPNMKLFMSVATWDLYEQAVIETANKGGFYDTSVPRRFKGKQMVPLAGMPDDTIFAAVGTPDRGSNLWVGTDVEDDTNTVQVERLQANSELFFFKMLFKMDTQIAFGEETVLYKA